MQDRRKKRNRVDKEANFIGDILRLLFALSIAVITIVAGFLLFKNISGFSLPNLKETEAITEQSKESVIITEESKEKKETTREAETEESKTEETESVKESAAEESIKEAEESKESKEGSSKQSKGEKESIGESPTLESKKSGQTEGKGKLGGEKSSSDNAEIGEDPKENGDTIEVGPGISSP